jgi:hypothetical protein
MTASVIPGVWDSRTAWDVKWQHFQSLTTPGGIRLPSCQDKYQAVENRVVVIKLAVYEQKCRVSSGGEGR